MSNKAVLDVSDKPKAGHLITLSFQHMFAMFGSTILVPQLVGLSPSIALLTSGIATIIFMIITQFKVPAYLGSSFAFIGSMFSAFAGGVSMSLGYLGFPPFRFLSHRPRPHHRSPRSPVLSVRFSSFP